MIIILLSIILILVLMLALNASLISSVILMSIISLFSALSYLVMLAPDVALTEAAVGACFSTCMLLLVIKTLAREELTFYEKHAFTIGALALFAILSYSALQFFPYGTPVAGAIFDYYKTHITQDIGLPSLVTAILASYRGFDTLGETTVIFIAGLSVLLILNYGEEIK